MSVFALLKQRKPAKSRERIMFRVERGALVPASELAVQALRKKGLKIGDQVSVDIRRSRNPEFHRLAHVLGQMLVENLETFAGLDAHAVLKRLQWESGVACDEMAVNVPNVGMVTVRIPQSLSFDTMDQGDFYALYTALCNHVRRTYWSALPEGEVERMAELFTREVA